MQKYYQSETKFQGIYSHDNLPKTLKDGTYIVNLDKYLSIETHYTTLYANGNKVTYFDSFDVEQIPEEIKRFISNKNIKIPSEYRPMTR